jgi:hypothetical protein
MLHRPRRRPGPCPRAPGFKSHTHRLRILSRIPNPPSSPRTRSMSSGASAAADASSPSSAKLASASSEAAADLGMATLHLAPPACKQGGGVNTCFSSICGCAWASGAVRCQGRRAGLPLHGQLTQPTRRRSRQCASAANTLSADARPCHSGMRSTQQCTAQQHPGDCCLQQEPPPAAVHPKCCSGTWHTPWRRRAWRRSAC